jgi:acyl homoserine lactone synthase
MREKMSCLSLIFEGIVQETQPLGAEHLIGLSQQSFPRIFRSFGYDCKRISEPYVCPEDGRKYAVLMMPTAKGFEEVKKAA